MSVSERTIIVDGLPVVDSDKYDKLLGFIKKKFIAFGGINHIYMPKNESGNTDGFLFITFDEKTSATAALELDHKPMDKKNTFRICMFDDYEKIKDTPAEYSPPDVSHLTKELPNLTTWLFDEQLRDQFVVRYSENQKAMTAIYWDDSHFDTENGGRTLENNGQDLGSAVWTDNAVQWSSQGLYFVTFHDQGAAIWGGEKFERLGRLSHANVNFISFSPCDRYAISHSTNGPKSSYRFWDLSTFSLIRVFDDIDAPTTSVTKYGADGKAVEVTQVPVKMDTDVFAFKWSFDGSYVARQIYGETTVVIQPPKDKKKDGEKQPAKITETRQIVLGLAVYTSPTFAQLDNKMIPANGAVDFIWSPIKNHLAYVTLGNVNLPSTLNVLEIPSRKIIRSKHTFGLVSGKIYWQSSGKHIVFTHSRIINSREKTYGADVIAMTVKNMPQYEVSLPSDPLHVSIDPIHPVFGCVFEGVNARNTAIKTCDVIFYRVNHIHCVEVAKFVPTSGAFAALTKLSFSPAGGVCIISCQASSSIIQFINVKKEIPTIMTNSSGESEHSHPKCNVVAWDPSGRHVALVTSRDKNAELLQRNRDSDSYSIWNFQGDKLVDVVVQNLYYFYWRPRPHTVLSPNKLKEVKANLESVYWKVFEAEEEQIRQAQRDEINQQRLAIKSKWLNSRQEAEAWVRANHPESIYDNSNDFIEIEDYVWEVQSVTKETVY